MTVPYTYLLYHIPTGLRYYGARWEKGCHPSDLWVKYETSSKYIKVYIAQYGKDSFSYSVRRVFDSPKKAQDWERKVLKKLKADVSEDWINKHIPGEGWVAPAVFSKEHKRKMSKAGKARTAAAETRRKMSEDRKGQIPWNKGIKHTEETKQKMSKNRKGIPGWSRGKQLSTEHKLKIAAGARLREQKKRAKAANELEQFSKNFLSTSQ